MKYRWIATTLFVLATAVPARPTHAEPIPDPPPPSDNAAVWYLTALQVMGDYDQKAKANIDQWREPDLDAAAEIIEGELSSALVYIRRGAAMDDCAWAVDIKRDGFGTLMPHLSMMRDYARFLAVSGQVRLHQGDAQGAIEDFVAIMRLSRHAAADGSLVGSLVQMSLDRLAAEALAKQLHRFDRDQLESLRLRLKQLPPPHTVRESIATERLGAQWLRDRLEVDMKTGSTEAWIRSGILKDGESITDENRDALTQQLDAWTDELDGFYQRLYDNLALPHDAFVKANQQYEEDVTQSKNMFVQMLMVNAGGAYQTERRSRSLHNMLFAAIAHRLGGAQAFTGVVDPADGKPYFFQESDEALVLASRLDKDGEPVKLRFAPELAEPLN